MLWTSIFQSINKRGRLWDWQKLQQNKRVRERPKNFLGVINENIDPPTTTIETTGILGINIENVVVY